MRYCFGDCVLDTKRYELHRAGARVPLRPKVFQVLAYLLAQHDRVVPKDELLSHVWTDQFISDETLSTCITELRQALGDSGQRQGLIQTRRGIGYRFIAPVTEVATPLPLLAPAVPQAAPPAAALEEEYKLVT